jgi:hypothetical protein
MQGDHVLATARTALLAGATVALGTIQASGPQLDSNAHNEDKHERLSGSGCCAAFGSCARIVWRPIKS